MILSAIEVLAFTEPADRYYGTLRHHLSSKGIVVGPNDLLIAAHALSEGLIVVTANSREFARVPELALENWLSN